MPYQGERANPYGYGDLLSSDFVEERLQSFLARGHEEEEDESLEAVPVMALEDLPNQESYDLTHVVAIDGSFQTVEINNPAVEVGFVKIGVVIENLRHLEACGLVTGPLDPRELARAYKRYSISTVLPGRGIEDGDAHLSGKRKYAKEVFANVKSMQAVLAEGQEGESLLEILAHLFPEGVNVYCEACADYQLLKLTSPQNCPSCGGMMLYYTDVLRLQERYNSSGGNSSVYSETMSTLERLLMAGLIKKAAGAPRALTSTAFVTDGPLGLFQARSLVEPLLRQAQDPTPRIPLLMGIEKTGAAVELMKQRRMQELLKPGRVLMFTPDVFESLKGNYNFGYSSNSFYGRKFAYRTKREDKTFIISLPPRRGTPLEHSEDVLEDWENYPTLQEACLLLERTSTDYFGCETAAITSIMEANSTASIPMGLGTKMLQEFVSRELASSAGVDRNAS